MVSDNYNKCPTKVACLFSSIIFSIIFLNNSKITKQIINQYEKKSIREKYAIIKVKNFKVSLNITYFFNIFV